MSGESFAVCAECIHVEPRGDHPERWRCKALVTLGPEKRDPQTGRRSQGVEGLRWCSRVNPRGGCADFEQAAPEVRPPPTPALRSHYDQDCASTLWGCVAGGAVAVVLATLWVILS